MTHTSITNLSRSKKKKNLSRIAMQERVLFPGRSFVFWLTLALLVLASILATEGEFIVEAICSPHCCQCNCAQGTSHRHLNKSRAQIRFPRKKKGQMDEENPAFARRTRPADYRIYFYDATLSKHILHNMTPRWLKKNYRLFWQNLEASEAGQWIF